jgi:RNA-directed DNA polymerase
MTAPLQQINTFDDLAKLIQVDVKVLKAFAYDRPDSKRYKTRPFIKRNGTVRLIAIPHSTLKMIQRRLLLELEKLYRPHSRAFAYIKGRGIRANATTHLGRRHIFSVDIKDFFDQINFGRVRGRLMAAPYGLSNSIATTIARLTTFDNKLPFGGPTSPIISNMICSGLDADLGKLGRDTGSFYTRFADDMVFSTQKSRFAHQIAQLVDEDGVGKIIPGPDLDQIVTKHGFTLNPAKTRLKSRQDRQIVCGVMCNEKLNVRRELRREIRAILNAWQKYGTDKTQEFWVSKYGRPQDSDFELSLRGKIEFMRHIRGKNDETVWKVVQKFNELTSGSPISYEPPTDWRAKIDRSICIVNAESSDMQKPTAVTRQGSGFVVQDGLIITNAHVACYDTGHPVEKLSVRFLDLALGDLDVELVRCSIESDVALLRVKDPILANSLICSRELEFDFSASTDIGCTVTLAGYPNFEEGDTCHVALGHVTGKSQPMKIELFRISQNVIYGNSGGPVLDDRGKVLGIAVCGSSVNDAPYTVHNGAIPAKAIRDFLLPPQSI